MCLPPRFTPCPPTAIAESHRVSLAHALSCIPRRRNKTPKKAFIQTWVCMSVPGTSFYRVPNPRILFPSTIWADDGVLTTINSTINDVVRPLGPRAECAFVHVRACAGHPIYSLDVSGVLKRSQNRGHRLDSVAPFPVHALYLYRVLESSAPPWHIYIYC